MTMKKDLPFREDIKEAITVGIVAIIMIVVISLIVINYVSVKEGCGYTINLRDLDCCNGSHFDPKTQDCCSGIVYSTDNHSCCDGELIGEKRTFCGSKCCPKGFKCCDAGPLAANHICYDPKTQVCI
jgi:hypothetical protein